MQDPRHPTGPMNPMGTPGGAPANRPTIQPNNAPGLRPAAPMSRPHAAPMEDEPIELVDDAAPAAGATEAFTSKIKALGEAGMHKKQHEWKRQTSVGCQGAARVRSFHGKYSDQGLQYLDDAINEWLDAHPDVEIKFVTSTVGVFEGKIREPALVLNLWY